MQNHIYKSKKQLELSTLDQENLRLKILQWQKDKADSLFYFRPYRVKQCHNEAEMEASTITRPAKASPIHGRFNGNSNLEEGKSELVNAEEFDETLLYVHQEQW